MCPHTCRMQRFNGLGSLVGEIGGYLKVMNHGELLSLNGLEGVTSTEDDLDISDNPKLQSLDGLSNIEQIGGYLRIYNNDDLTSLAGLEKVMEWTRVFFVFNLYTYVNPKP